MKVPILLFLLHDVSAIDKSWWKHTTIYQIFVWSFKDTNGDGIGDLKGITWKLDHFVDLGIETLYLSPIFKSPMQDSGYDVSDYTEIDPVFGTMEDFEELIREMNRKGMKLVIDFVINHSSDTHEWFQKSIEKIPPYADYYIWKDPKDYNADGNNPNPPNNWLSIFGGSAWEWNDKRKQFYFHQFSVKQPDFNLRNIQLKKEINKIMRFWLRKGIAGMRLDATKFFFEDPLFTDECIKNENLTGSADYEDYFHNYTTDLRESYEFIHDIRTYIDNYSIKKNDFERIIIAEAYTSLANTMQYYDTKDYPITHFPFNFYLFGVDQQSHDARHFNHLMLSWLDNMPEGSTANWNVENHDNPRVETRLNREFSDILLISIMMAPGVAYVYYGQEIGMSNYLVRPDQRRDSNSYRCDGINRDGERVPMQWDSSMNAGFTGNNLAWLPVNSNYWRTNVESEKKQPNSVYNTFKTLSSLRKTKTLKYGDFKSYVISTWVFAFTRTLKDHDTYLVVHNLGSETEFVDLHINIKGLPRFLEIIVSSSNSGYEKGTKIPSRPKFPDMFLLRPSSSLVLKTISK